MTWNRPVRGLVCASLAALALLPLDAPATAGTPGIARAPEFQQRVDGAIGRGVEWLRGQQAPDGSFPDFPGFDAAITALAYHTMRVCGVKADDPAAKKAWSALRRDATPETLQTYSAGLFLMAAQERGVPDRKAGAGDGRVKLDADDLKWVREVAGRLARGQTNEGSWSYDVGPSEYEGDGKKDKKDKDRKGKDPKDGAGPGEVFGFRTSGDFSNTQYALLGLKCAARCGVPVNATVWNRALTLLLDAQEATGPETERGTGPAPAVKGSTSARSVDQARGWAYTSRDARTPRRAYASMTAGGVSSVVLCRSELLEQRALPAPLATRSEQAAWDGLAWLGTRWRPGDVRGRTDCYEYYGVERAGILAGVDWMAALDWYGAGAEPLLAAQDAEGAWTGVVIGILPGTPGDAALARRIADTCFALLFLKRGTTPVRMGAVTHTEGDSDIDFAAAAKLTGRDLEDLLDLVLARWARTADESARTRLFDGATSLGPRIVPPLLLRMSDEDAATRAPAHALLRHATGFDHGYDAHAARERREESVELWQAWWLGAERELRYDAATRRLTR